ncbi:TipC family immunity protein [Gemella morbillorum]|uniref:TipC family immunity protein n=1 Tax=Gemella morbillorum TaxID=29391 RepID=UPI0030B8B915
MILKIIMKRGRFFKKRLNEYWVTLIIILTLIGGYYAYHKIIIKNVFEEMYNSYYNILSIKSIDNMPQIKPIPRDEKHLDSVDLNYKNNTEDVIINIFLVNRENKKEIILICSRLIASGVYLDINYDYDMKTHKLINDITFHGENAPNVDDGKKQTRELLEKHNISKEYLQKKSGELLDTVLTDWQKYSGSSYSRSNMGRLTIEKDEFLG